MTQLTRCYLRASTDAQDATRARSAVEAFAADHGLTIAGWFIENESGAKFARPELFRLLATRSPATSCWSSRSTVSHASMTPTGGNSAPSWT